MNLLKKNWIANAKNPQKKFTILTNVQPVKNRSSLKSKPQAVYSSSYIENNSSEVQNLSMATHNPQPWRALSLC